MLAIRRSPGGIGGWVGRGKHNIHGQHTRMERLLKVSPWDGGVIRDEFVELIGKALVAGQGERKRGDRITLFVCHLLLAAEAHKAS